MTGILKQEAGKLWTFVRKKTGDTDTGILPQIGESNAFAFWVNFPKEERGGHWFSRKAKRARNKEIVLGEGPSALLGKMKLMLNQQRSPSGLRGRKPPTTTPEDMLAMWLAQNGNCAACGSPLSLIQETYNGPRTSCFDHNHETGEPRGFIHNHCNKAEGYLSKMTKQEFKNYIAWVSEIHKRGNQ
jgi:hypothetical protein